MAAVRHSFAVPAAVEPFDSPAGTSEGEETTAWAPQDGAPRPLRPALRVRRPTAAQPPPPPVAPQQPAAPQPPAAPPPFMFGTPGELESFSCMDFAALHTPGPPGCCPTTHLPLPTALLHSELQTTLPRPPSFVILYTRRRRPHRQRRQVAAVQGTLTCGRGSTQPRVHDQQRRQHGVVALPLFHRRRVSCHAPAAQFGHPHFWSSTRCCSGQ